MSLASRVAGVLRESPAPLVQFRIDTISVGKLQMESVARAIENQDVLVEVRSTGPKLGAAYSSWRGRRVAPGERELTGRISLGSADVVSSPSGRAAIFHESVHALMDVAKIKVSMHNDEVAAYLADAMYLRVSKASIKGGKAEMAIYDAAFGLIDAHAMLASKGAVALSWTDCSALRDAIKAHPAYS